MLSWIGKRIGSFVYLVVRLLTRTVKTRGQAQFEETSPFNSNQFEFVGQFPQTKFWSLRPCMKILYFILFYFIVFFRKLVFHEGTWSLGLVTGTLIWMTPSSYTTSRHAMRTFIFNDSKTIKFPFSNGHDFSCTFTFPKEKQNDTDFPITEWFGTRRRGQLDFESFICRLKFLFRLKVFSKSL